MSSESIAKITSNIDVVKNKDLRQNYIRDFYHKLFSKPDLKVILFVEDCKEIICLYHHYELNPDEFEIVILFRKAPKQDFKTDLISYVYVDGVSTVSTYIDLIRRVCFTLHSVLRLNICFSFLFHTNIFNDMISSIKNTHRKIIRFCDFRCKGFLYLFLHYIITNGIQVKISPHIYNLVTTIDYETLRNSLESVDDTVKL